MYGAMTALWEQADFPKQAVDLGWITDNERKELPGRLGKESMQAGVLNGTTFVEVVGKKPPSEQVQLVEPHNKGLQRTRLTPGR